MDLDLTGRVALVTGAKGLLGGKIVEALAREGVRVIASDVQVDGPATAAGPISWTTLDVTNESQWQQVAAGIRKTHGRLDVLVNNAGIAVMNKFEETSLGDWRRTMSINVEGTFLGMKSCTALLRESGASRDGGSSIINIASGAADRPAAFSTTYCTSKAAVMMLTRSTAVEFGALGYPIRVNSVHPGAVNSPMMEQIMARYEEILGHTVTIEQLRAQMKTVQPMGRMVEADEVADAVVFLASRAARFVHADRLHVDGGYAGA